MRTSAANAERAVGRLNLMSGATAVRSGSEPERALGGIDHSLATATVRIINELVELHARVRTDVQIGLVVKTQTGLAGLIGTDGLGEGIAGIDRDRFRQQIHLRRGLILCRLAPAEDTSAETGVSQSDHRLGVLRIEL
jgi:hypothetical protein